MSPIKSTHVFTLALRCWWESILNLKVFPEFDRIQSRCPCSDLFPTFNGWRILNRHSCLLLGVNWFPGKNRHIPSSWWTWRGRCRGGPELPQLPSLKYILWEKLFWQVPWWWWRRVRSGIRKTDACWVIKRSSSPHSCYYYHEIFHIPPTGAVPLRKCMSLIRHLFLPGSWNIWHNCSRRILLRTRTCFKRILRRYQDVKCLKSLLLFILIMFKWQLPFPNCLVLFTNKILLGWDFVKVHAHNNCMLWLATNIQTPRIPFTQDQNA